MALDHRLRRLSLLVGGAGDLRDHGRRSRRAGEDLLESGAARFGEALLSSAIRMPSLEALTASWTTSCRPDDAGDVRGRLGRAVGEVANLFGDDRKPAAGITARAASIEAFSDSRFVRSAIRLMVSTIELMSPVVCPSRA
jgi:hypothetical protein